MQASLGRNIKNNTLTRTIICKNFLHAVDIINTITPVVEQDQHHPDIELRNYKELTISLTTHDAGNTVTQKDLDLANKINTLLL